MTTTPQQRASGATAVDEDVVTLIHAQHDEIKHLFTQLNQVPTAEREGLFCDLRRLLAVHETAEEEVVYPVLRAQGGEGDDIADVRIAEEGRAKQHLADLERLGTDDPTFMAQLHALRDEIIAHATNEETEVFPLLRATVDARQRQAMARAFRLAEAAAPTHPHPHGPDSATGNLLVGPFVAIADRVRDALRGTS